MNRTYLLLPLSLCTLLAVAAEAPAPAQAPRYVYGMPLDVRRVIAIDEPPNVCGLVDARLTYEDAKGQRRQLDYRKWSSSCGIAGDGGMHSGF